MNKHYRLKRKAKIAGVLLTLIFAIAFLLTGGLNTMKSAFVSMQKYFAAGDLPVINKGLDDNNNGTYKLSLSVKGDAEKQVQKVNVVVIVDRSGSMGSQSGTSGEHYTATNSNDTGLYGLVDGEFVPLERRGGMFNRSFWYNGVQYTGQRYRRTNGNMTRMEATKEAVHHLSSSLLSNNGKDGNPDDVVEMALVSFATTANTNIAKTSSSATFANGLYGLSVASGNYAGTNWEDALQEANSVNFGDSDPTYVIFFSDGSPTFRNTRAGYNDAFNDISGIYGTGQEEQPNMERAYTQATDDASTLANKIGTDKFYTIFAYGTTVGSNYMTSLTTAAGAPAENNYSAASTSELQDAFAEILEKIEMSGIGNAVIDDGTTNTVATSSGVAELLEVDENSYKYYKVDKDGNETVWSKPDEDTSLRAHLVDGHVVWDISSEGVLENDVTYKVTFDVYPSQDTYDMIANIKNGKSALERKALYEALDENIRNYLKPTSEEYTDFTLRTNTTATLSYDDTRTEEKEKPITFKNPDPVNTEAPKIEVTKKWENELDSQSSQPVVMDLKRDGKVVDTLSLNTDAGWTDSKFISPGLLKYTRDQENNITGIEVLNTGHDYTLTEPEDLDYYWELDIETVHPMIIDGDLTTLVKVTDKDIPSGMESADYYADGDNKYYRINNEVYYAKYNGDTAILTATNNRKSNLNVKKVVSGDALEGEKFKFNFNVINVGDTDTWFSVWDTKENKYVYDLDTNAKHGSDHPTNPGGEESYYVENGNDFYVYLEDGWNLRFFNLGTGSTYSVEEEVNSPYELTNVDAETIVTSTKELPTTAVDIGNNQYRYGKEGDPDTIIFTKEVDSDGNVYYSFSYTPQVENEVTTGEVVAPNTSYNVIYENTYPATNLEVEKIWNDGEPEEGTEVVFTLYQNGEPTDKTLTLPENGKWSGIFKNLDLTDDEGNLYEYSAVESEVEGYTAFYTGTAKALVSAKNVPEGTNTITATVKADGEAAATVILDKDGSWINTSDEFDFVNSDGSLKEIDVESDVEDADVSFILTDRKVVVTNYEKIDITVTKNWEDNDNQDGKRVNVDITLYADDEEVASHTFNTSTTNSYTFENLDKYKVDENRELVDIVYSVDEVEVPDGYDKDVSGSLEAGFVVTNTHEPETTTSTVVKVWNDNDDNDGKRPESIVVSFSGDNTDYTLSDDNDWTKTISDLPKYKDGEEIVYTWTEVEVPDGYELSTSVNGTTTTLTNTHDDETTESTVVKVWNDNDNNDGKRPDSLVVVLKDGDNTVAEKTLTEDNGWTVTVEGLPKYRDGEEIVYTWSEPTVPDGYTLEDPEVEGTVTTLTNTHDDETTTSTVVKVWNDNDDNDGKRPESIVVSFSGDNTDYTLSDDNDWTKTISDLPKYKDGEEIVYTWTEVEVPDGYELSTSVNGTITTLTNTHDDETVNSKVTKVWDDDEDRDGKRQTSLNVTLKGDNNVVATDVLTDDNDWTVTVEGLPKYKDGNEISYIWSEGELKEGYAMASSTTDPEDETNTIITNHYDPETTRVCIKKVWDDDDDRDGKRPLSLKVTLSNGQSVLLNSDNDWYAEIDNLYKYENHGSLINYTWSEEDVDDYELTGDSTEAELTTLTNSYTPETTTATVVKVWDDEDDNDDKRPEGLVVELTANDPSFKAQEVTLSESNGWTATVEGLPKYMNSGKDEVIYTWNEVDIPDGYTLLDPVVDGTTTTLTNKHVPETTKVPVEKIWDERANTFGFDSPESVKVNLMADGTKVRDIVLSDDNDWKHVFEDLPKYKNKKEITYLVEEEEVSDYDFSLAGNATEGFKITNTYNPKLVPVKVTKTWNDKLDQDGKRDGSIIFILTGKVGEDVVYTSPETPISGSPDDEKWYYTFENLPEKYHGEVITYSVTEKLPDGSVYTGENVSDIEVMNSYDPQTVSFNLTKIWDDDDDNDCVRPKSITVHLLADGVEVETAIITADDDWSWSISGLPKYRNHGVAIKYTILEDIVSGYKPPVISYTEEEEKITSTITNTHENEKASLDIQKVWVDDNNKYKLRPKTITVQIFANGKLVRTIEITEADNWRKVISDLNKYLQGEEITYTILELPVDGYSTTIDGYTITNTILPIGKTEITPPNTKVGDTDTKSNLLLLIILLATSVISAVTTSIKN